MRRGCDLSAADAGTTVRRELRTLTLLANLFGAIVTFCYFRFIDPVAAAGARPGAFELTYAIVGFALIMVVGRAWGERWLRPLRGGPGVDPALVQRRAVAVPYILAAITMAGWVAAGLIWGVLWPLTAGQFSFVGAARQFFAIACVAGTVATAFIFFAVERRWRQVLPTFFPDGDISSVAGVIRLSVRARLLIIFFVVGVVPLSILGVFTYTRSLDLLDAGPAEARQIVAWTVP